MKPMMMWYRGTNRHLDMLPEHLAIIGFDDMERYYISASYGGCADSVVAKATADMEPLVYRRESPYVRVDWLKKRYPACVKLFRKFDLALFCDEKEAS